MRISDEWLPNEANPALWLRVSRGKPRSFGTNRHRITVIFEKNLVPADRRSWWTLSREMIKRSRWPRWNGKSEHVRQDRDDMSRASIPRKVCTPVSREIVGRGSRNQEAGGRHSCLPVHADHAKSGRQECLPPALVSVPGRSARGEFGDHIRLAVLSARELIGGVGEVSGEAAFVGVEGDPRAERGGVGFEIDTIFS